MTDAYFANLNWWAVIVSGAAYWILGAIWFSGIFGKAWGAELEKHGVKIQKPTTGQMNAKLVQTFVLNTLVAFGISLVVFFVSPPDAPVAVKLGLFLGICFAAALTGIAYTWEGKSLKLFLIDAGYPVLGITICTVILSLWRPESTM